FTRVFPGNRTLVSGPDLKPKPTPGVFPGNTSFDVGDTIPIPKGGGGGGGGPEGSPDDMDAEDDFIWVNEAELLNILFEGRSLPDMTKLKATQTQIVDREHSGYTNKGPDHRMDAERTNAKRREESIVLGKSGQRRVFENLTEQFNIYAKHANEPSLEAIETKGKSNLERNQTALDASAPFIDMDDSIKVKDTKNVLAAFKDGVEALKDRFSDLVADEADQKRLSILENRLEEQLKGQKKTHKFREEHLTYEYDDDIPKPNAKAVMFCQMDVSASMGQEEKNTAKVFFWLLKQFLNEKYDEVDIVFIAHTTEAKEVDEQNFFYGTETGGTIVSTCMEKTQEIINERYPVSEWNIYSAQASDGDNSPHDNMALQAKMNELLPLLQAHYYVEVAHPRGWGRRGPSEMHNMYESMAGESGKIYTEWGLQSAVDALEAFKKFFPIGGKPAPANDMAPS
ncbi:MAG: DUF444 family protein, partial [Alphaproteobacteria bacterium]